MADELVGLEISGPGNCGKPHPQSGRPCVKPRGHEGSGDDEHSTEVEAEPDAPTCPDCGNHMTLEFSVQAENEEVANRVFQSYLALKHLDMDKLRALANGEAHLHIAEGAGCEPADDGDGA